MKKAIGIAVLLLSMMGIAAAVENVDVYMDVDNGVVEITTNGIDHSIWHPGSIGQQNSLDAIGNFIGTYKATEGNYGALSSYVNVNAVGAGAYISMIDEQDFNVLSANHINNVTGVFFATAAGPNASMNLASVGSMYVYAEATSPYYEPGLQGQFIEKGISTKQNNVTQSELYLSVNTNGIAFLSNSNIWGWSNSETGSSTTNYAGGIRAVSATGDGAYTQTGYGADSLIFNGINFGAGSAVLLANFNGGMSGTYSMSAN